MIKSNAKKKKVINKKKGIVRQKHIKELADNDLELESRLQKLHDLQMIMLDEKTEMNVRYMQEKTNLNAKINDLENILDEKQAEFRKLKAKNEELKLRLEFPDNDARIEQAVEAVKKENQALKNIVKNKEAEFKKLKEMQYVNEDAVKKMLGSRNIEAEKIRKEQQVRTEELKKKFSKEKELLEQYLKIAREETEKLKKEISIKNILSDL